MCVDFHWLLLLSCYYKKEMNSGENWQVYKQKLMGIKKKSRHLHSQRVEKAHSFQTPNSRGYVTEAWWNLSGELRPRLWQRPDWRYGILIDGSRWSQASAFELMETGLRALKQRYEAGLKIISRKLLAGETEWEANKPEAYTSFSENCTAKETTSLD